ncbi:DUF3179 domain-containing protein [Methanohalobium sp.]|uniref:DUF3179 domain-containing protein n=1 Tax=Methanohalobium sp. TaxID=2837493 RepID=UPI0025F88B2A|nr:DUF3179 domain-containing protein [Methanohalobium sp.]
MHLNNIKLIVLLFFLMFIFISGCVSSPPQTNNLTEEEIAQGIELTEDGQKYLVHPDKLASGGPGKDGIPSIDNPTYNTVDEADRYLSDDELVMALNYNGKKRVYPLQIMVWHEIVNDDINGQPVLITYCPLCGSTLAFERKVQGDEVEFGTSGKLYNSNLVMYDRKTDTYWAQLTGQAIVGELTGEELTPISIDTIYWGNWKRAHPDSQVLSRDTGARRSYGEDPYTGYYNDSSLLFPVENRDDRIHPKAVVFSIEVNDSFKAYQEDDLKNQGTISDNVGGTDIEIERNDIGIVSVTNLDTGEKITKVRTFWFAWYAFHPETALYSK